MNKLLNLYNDLSLIGFDVIYSPNLSSINRSLMLVGCMTCKYYDEICFKDKNRYNCLSEESPPQLMHYKYRHLMKKHIKFKFIHWEPQEEKPTPYGGLLSDEDFEL